MKKKLLYGIIGIAIVVLLTAIIIGIYVSNRVAESTGITTEKAVNAPVDYHLMILVNDSDDTYKDEFLNGVTESSLNHRIAYEIVKVDSSNYEDSLLDAFDKAVYAGADGIALDTVPSSRLSKKISLASEAGIPVFTMNEDLPESGRIAFVGIDREVIGLLVAGLFEDNLDSSASVAIIEQSLELSAADTSNYEDGLIAGMQDRLEEGGWISLEAVYATEQGVLSAETVATALLHDHPDINGIFCDNGKNTLGVVQVILENNLVNELVLIGSDDTGEIMDYIQKGNIIEASIVKDNHDLGYEVVKAFSDFKQGKDLSERISTRMSVIDAGNVEDYINEISNEKNPSGQ